MRTRGRWIVLLTALLPVPAMAQNTVVSSLPRPAAYLQDSRSPATPFIPSPDVPSGPPTSAVDVFARPERFFAFSMEAQLLFPVVHQRLQSPITVPGFYTDTARLPFVGQGLAGALAFSVRTRAFGGDVGITYRGLASEGNSSLAGFDPFGNVPFRSRLDMHHIDLDYSSPEGRWFSQWIVRGDFGARLASVYFDSQATGPIFDRKISNYFLGAGPHAGVRLTRPLGDSGIALMSRLDAGAMIGGIRQQFRDIVFDGNGTALGFGSTTQSSTRGVPVLVVELGIGAAPGNTAWGNWQFGYQFEQWWAVGNIGGSAADVINQGMYARWLFNY